MQRHKMQARFKTSSLAGSLPPRTDGLADYSLIGERIYHVPGQKFYSQTSIRPEFGERWFRGASTTGGLAKIEAMSRANSDEAYVLAICDEVFGAISEK